LHFLIKKGISIDSKSIYVMVVIYSFMMKKIAVSVTLVVITATLWFTNYNYPNFYSAYILKGFYTFLALIIIYIIFKVVLEELIVKKLKQTKMKYSFKKTISILYILISFFAFIAIWIEHTETILISFGLIGAGIAVALQDIFKNFAGGITIFSTGIYRVGDRIEINGKLGDVVDIGIFFTTVMEIGEWVDGNQATGRLTTIPNSSIHNSNVNNFTKDHNFIWDEITLPITYDSNWKKAHEKIINIVKKETEQNANKADKEISKLGEKYYLPAKPVEPVIFLTITDNYIKFNIRYVTDTRERRILRDRLSRLILEEFENSKDVDIASETIDVSLKRG
jgi:small-conductance mechanosensitive channel